MKKLLIWIIKFYKRRISPLKKPCCRFYPTCSEYSLQAIERYGALKGAYLAIRRIIRCHPFCDGGFDPLK